MERVICIAGILLCKIWKKPLKISALWGKRGRMLLTNIFLMSKMK